MKHFGCTLSFSDMRDNALLAAYRKLTHQCRFILNFEIAEAIVNSPAPRFWVSEERATAVISLLLRGKPALARMRPTKREMFSEILRRVRIARTNSPGKPLSYIINDIIHSPAPKFYMAPSSALDRIFKLRKANRNERLQRHPTNPR